MCISVNTSPSNGELSYKYSRHTLTSIIRSKCTSGLLVRLIAKQPVLPYYLYIAIRYYINQTIEKSVMYRTFIRGPNIEEIVMVLASLSIQRENKAYKLALAAIKTGYPLCQKCSFTDFERIMENIILSEMG